jgi:hypothetical protein
MSVRSFLIENKWWWIVPILLVVGLVGFILWRSHNDDAPKADSPFQYDAY